MRKLFGLLLTMMVILSCEEGLLLEPSLKFAEGESLTFNGFETKRLTVVHTPEDINLGEGNIKWSSSDVSVAKARRGGFVEALGVGSCDVIAEAYVSDQLVRAVCHVKVNEVGMTSLMVDSAQCILIGEGVRLTASFKPSNSTYTELYWSCSDESVATVDAEGYVKGIKDGSCVVSVTNKTKDLVAKCLITVMPIEMTSLSLDKTECEIELGDVRKLIASFEPSDVTYPYLEWSSSDESVATVDAKGLVRTRGLGTCIISVANKENGLTAECQVKVYAIEIRSISCLEEKALECGESFVLSATFEPSNVTPGCSTLYWESSDESVARVNKETGEVTGVGVGECTVTVGNTYNDVKAECQVKVYVLEITAISCLEEKALECGESFVLSATFEPSNVTPGCSTLYWESSDESVARVNKETGEVTGVGVGECTITVGNTYNDVKAECHLTVLPVSVKGLSLDRSFLTIAEGRTDKLSCTVTPANAANKAVKWESSDESIVTVSDDGTVTAIGEGLATIKVTALDGSGCSAVCAVEVVTLQYMEEYVEDYIENKVLITITGTGIQIPGGSYYIYKINNIGDKRVYVKEAKGGFTTHSVDKYVEPNSYIVVKVFSDYEQTWTIVLGGISHTKERDDK